MNFLYDYRILSAGFAYFFVDYGFGSVSAAVAAAIAGWELGGSFGEVQTGDLLIARSYAQNGSFPRVRRAKMDTIKWTPLERIRNVLPEKKSAKTFYVDNFQFSKVIKNKLNILNTYLAKKAEKEERRLPWESLKKGSLIVGSMGQGKTEFLNNIIEQWIATDRKMVIHDTKGEFTSYFYRDGKDYIINNLDRRGVWWDFFADNAKGMPFALVYEFFRAYFTAVAGDKGDKFWQQMAGQRFREKFEDLKLDRSIPTAKKMEVLVLELHKYLDEAKKSTNKTEQSIATTLEISLKIFEKFAWMAKQGRRSITLTDFFKSKDARLFLHTIEAVAAENTPFLTAFLTTMARYQLTFFEKAKEEDWVLYILDEYLTFFEKMEQDVRRSMHTKARSYGMLLLPAVQYIPADDSVKEVLVGSVENMFVFAVTDQQTINYLKDFVGKIKITAIEKKKNKYDQNEYKEEERYLLDENVLKSFVTGKHLTYLPKRKILYLGYSELPGTQQKTDAFVPEKFEEENDFVRFRRNLGTSSMKGGDKRDEIEKKWF